MSDELTGGRWTVNDRGERVRSDEATAIESPHPADPPFSDQADDATEQPEE